MFVDYDLEFFLTVSVLVTGCVVLLPRIKSLFGRRASVEKSGKKSWLQEICCSIFPVLLIVLIIRGFVVEPFRIPSGSMFPTLEIGDFILVNKFIYGLKLPVLHYHFLKNNDPEMGDVVVFRHPRQPQKDYIKRVVGVPGDKVTYLHKQLFINGIEMPLGDPRPYRPRHEESLGYEYVIFNESFAENSHEILNIENRIGRSFTWDIPADRYLVMGDNRDNSHDSRAWGLVPKGNIVGRAFLIWLHWDFGGEGFDAGRIGTKIQ